ncbi:MAG: aminoacyl-tRNA hydrolase [Bryobacterales bacterium]|nr:aminoacyl-tRNA hydrolase [Bryobacteraceae bacterium]MDW8129554.1 aminoacyl-tRNA hydrolase [Bryobacterales bacterium]
MGEASSAAAVGIARKFLVVGLGNPGRRYELSPHNMGFMVVDRLAAGYGIPVNRALARSLVGEGLVAGVPVVLAKPMTYMNLSGEAVQALMQRKGFTPAELLVVYDDHDLPWGALRIRRRGSAGGHHGMESIIEALETEDFIRVRLGIDPGGGERADPEFLLSPMGPRLRADLPGFLDYAAQAVVAIISEGVEKAMTRFNRRALGQTEEGE